VSFTTSNSNYTISVLQDFTDYYWHVRASDGNTWGQWSSTWKFTTKTNDVSIKELDVPGFQVYPNPTSGFIIIKVEDINIQSIKIMNIFGQIFERIIPGTTNEIAVSITGASGVYFAELMMDSGELKRIKIIKE
ncbi:MAG: T9SS type A sorting domain-containing protein, partial [Candidatus Lokiarchaeia archaeon]|nr:T9SS type A sorting domain-containing protein [Candidatus Lokiarchaeia archaeon]